MSEFTFGIKEMACVRCVVLWTPHLIVASEIKSR